MNSTRRRINELENEIERIEAEERVCGGVVPEWRRQYVTHTQNEIDRLEDSLGDRSFLEIN